MAVHPGWNVVPCSQTGVGTDFRHAVEFSRSGCAPATVLQPFSGQLAQHMGGSGACQPARERFTKNVRRRQERYVPARSRHPGDCGGPPVAEETQSLGNPLKLADDPPPVQKLEPEAREPSEVDRAGETGTTAVCDLPASRWPALRCVEKVTWP